MGDFYVDLQPLVENIKLSSITKATDDDRHSDLAGLLTTARSS